MTGRFRRHPVSTYRLQLNGGFRFTDALALVPYLTELGVTACYSSPHLKANPGSSHGYDISEHNLLNPELGTEEDYAAFCDALAANGLGHIMDVVPNHMAADPASNPWWRDVLEDGPSSPYCDFFDVDWNPIKPELSGKVLLPVLGDQYGLVLERGEIQLRFVEGTLVLTCGDLTLPFNPRQVPRAIGRASEHLDPEADRDDSDVREFLSIMTALSNLPVYTDRDPVHVAERHRETAVARDRLVRLVAASPRIARHVEASLTRVNGVAGAPASFDVLHDLLERQAYRLAYWRTAFDEINYRRFFDVNSLIALRMEAPGVFEATHALVERLIREGRVTGLRVDHPDGLFDPKAYLDRLQHLAVEARQAGNARAAGGEPFYVVVEKVLSAGESLQPDWPVAGTTGYDFLNQVAGLFIDGRNASRLRRAYARQTGQQSSFDEVAYQCKRVITLTSMASELSVLAHELNRLSEADRRNRDFTLDSCRKVLREILACVPVYRTYICERGASDFDRRVVEIAIEEAKRRNPVMEESIFQFVHDVVLPADEPAPAAGREVRRFAMRFQQFSGPVQAKGVEDTAFYRYHVLAAANDVGGHPGRLGVSPADFHAASQRRLAEHPLSMTTTSTHDTKRGEDARVRLAVLSEMPDAWRRVVSDWMRTNARNRGRIGTMWAPDRNDEYLFYQAVLGAWPQEPHDAPIPQQAPPELVSRIGAYMQKAVREAKVHTSWIDRDQRYGRAVAAFADRTLRGRTAARFLHSFVPFARLVARVGAVNALSQVVLKIASPGVPDFYQGSELWDLSLVDPDNRRPVDFVHRQALLAALQPTLERLDAGGSAADEVTRLLADWPDGRVKLFVTARGLRFRRKHADLLTRGAYLPLDVRGPASDHVVAFARHDHAGTLIAAVPRLVSGRLGDDPRVLGVRGMESTTIVLPDALTSSGYRHLLTGERVDRSTGGADDGLAAAAVFRTSPVGLLWSD